MTAGQSRKLEQSIRRSRLPVTRFVSDPPELFDV